MKKQLVKLWNDFKDSNEKKLLEKKNILNKRKMSVLEQAFFEEELSNMDTFSGFMYWLETEESKQNEAV